uniref:Decorsin variant 2 n=1 Tax=Macrobdella decora TaxID=6405 RepID=A0A482JVG1_MACDE|nr:decorsin variant 2 [Macrobdella decora]
MVASGLCKASDQPVAQHAPRLPQCQGDDQEKCLCNNKECGPGEQCYIPRGDSEHYCGPY